LLKKAVLIFVIVILLYGIYIFIESELNDKVTLNSQKRLQLSGIFYPNERLQSVEKIGLNIGFGPEDVAFDEKGQIYTGVSGGNIIRLDSDGKNAKVFANTGGRPLGLAFDDKQNLIVADREIGLISISSRGRVSTLANEAGGKPIIFANDLDISSDGTIYFTDTAIYKRPKQAKIEGRPNGRLIAYYPETHKTKVLMEGLSRPNGTTLSKDESYILICEMSEYRVIRLWLSGSSKGSTDVFIDNLPGSPDNISFNGTDTYWIALLTLRYSFTDSLSNYPPLLRNMIIDFLFFLKLYPKSPPYGFVLGVNQDGRVIYNLQDPSGIYASDITSAKEHKKSLYLGTINDNYIKRLSLN
jgi:sugar lactone lactonase YvrE